MRLFTICMGIIGLKPGRNGGWWLVLAETGLCTAFGLLQADSSWARPKNVWRQSSKAR